MPSFAEQLAIIEGWARFPGRTRVEGPHPALTFDDGPDPDATPAVLDALDEIGVQATFFMVGEQVEDHGHLARAVVERGHRVGLHGMRHVRPDQLTDPVADLRRAAAVVHEATGVRVEQFRPPYGAFDAPLYEAAKALDLEPVLWSAWGLDWEPIPAHRIAELVTTGLEPGGIVVLHDSARYAPRESAAATADAVRLLGNSQFRLG